MDDTGWGTPIDAYCERTSAAFWSEPVNAASNLAFVLAACLAAMLWRRAGADDRPVLLLIGVAAIVGIGSFLFHTFANRWSLVADVLPITVFIYGFFLLAMRRFFGLGPVAAFALTAAFIAFNGAFVRVWKAAIGDSGVATANGSVGYFPAALALIAVGAVLMVRSWRAERALGKVEAEDRRSGPAADERARAWRLRVLAPDAAGHAILAAAALFAVSLVLRSIDLALCSWWPLGTHFLWHLLNGAVLFVLLRAAIRHRTLTGGTPP